MKTVLLWLLFGVLLAPRPSMAAAFPVHMETMDLGVLATGRPAIIDLWYPRGTCPELKAPLDTMTHKVVVFSHGAMGAAKDYTWLGENLASAGFIVVGMNHYGESRAYGTDTQDTRDSSFVWQRAQDISALLDRLTRANLFQKVVNWNTVVAIGHSSGGPDSGFACRCPIRFASADGILPIRRLERGPFLQLRAWQRQRTRVVRSIV